MVMAWECHKVKCRLQNLKLRLVAVWASSLLTQFCYTLLPSYFHVFSVLCHSQMLLCQECIYLYIIFHEKVIYLQCRQMEYNLVYVVSTNPCSSFFAFTFKLNCILNATICTVVCLSKACCSLKLLIEKLCLL